MRLRHVRLLRTIFFAQVPRTSPLTTHGSNFVEEEPLDGGYFEYSQSVPASDSRYIEGIPVGLLDTP
ncbi:hypothetical protein AYI69_g8933 [Smittium culicis]|uniref:Uncharacterized protein n=1 Tax=Smittium culicis TaxID=133412 RepID=A0A1R1XG64_9FUNG|nr:hypothetical protein AYI69_g8933 [Smittium culicis]